MVLRERESLKVGDLCSGSFFCPFDAALEFGTSAAVFHRGKVPDSPLRLPHQPA